MNLLEFDMYSQSNQHKIIMKKITILLLAILIQVSSSFGIDDKKVKSSIKDVTVFLQGAQVHRKGFFQVNKGQTRIIFEGMTQAFDKNSIQVKGKGDFIILEVSSNIFYPQPTEVVPTTMPDKVKRDISRITDSITDLSWEMKLLDREINAYNQELNMLMGSGVITGLSKSDSIALLKNAMEYTRVKVKELNSLLHQSEMKKSEMVIVNNNLNERLRTLQNWNANVGHQPQTNPQPIQQIIVTIQADKTVDGSIEMSYMTWNAGWSPAYDLRADDISEPTKITYKAKVYQNTGIDWNNVDVTLSSINPNMSNNKPVMAPWYLDFYSQIQPVQELRAVSDAKVSNLSELHFNYNESTQAGNVVMEDDLDADHLANYTSMSENLTMVEFDLNMKYSIKSDGKEHVMAIKSEEIPTKYQYYAVPRLDKDAFLLAKLTDWEGLNLLPAVANIYYDGTYVGQTRINPSQMTDTLDLALGRDRDIFITRKKAKIKTEEKLLKSDIVKTYAFEISLKNNKTAPLNIIIEDQIPVTANEDIKIDLIEKAGSDFNKKSGFLTWNLTIPAKKQKKMEFKYTIKHDKDESLTFR